MPLKPPSQLIIIFINWRGSLILNMSLKEVLNKAKVISEEKKLEIEKNLEYLKNIINATNNVYRLQEEIFTKYGYILGKKETSDILIKSIINRSMSIEQVDELVWKQYQDIDWKILPKSNHWDSIPKLKDRKKIISECIDILRISKGNIYRPIIYTLISHIEGLCRDIIQELKEVSENKKNISTSYRDFKKYIKLILEGIAYKKQLSYNSKSDPIITDHIFSKLITEYLFMDADHDESTEDIRPKNQFLLSRHKIIHGNIFTDEALSKGNLIRLLLIFVYLGDIYYRMKNLKKP
jgi:hypothetical protein